MSILGKHMWLRVQTVVSAPLGRGIWPVGGPFSSSSRRDVKE